MLTEEILDEYKEVLKPPQDPGRAYRKPDRLLAPWLRDGSTFVLRRDIPRPRRRHLLRRGVGRQVTYRKMQARSSLKAVSAGAVKTAVKELEATVAAKRQMAPRLAVRAKTIASRIAEAERMGAGNCTPGGVARIRMELEQAFIEARLARSTLSETESLFDRAERYANYLLSERRLASNRGDSCR